MFLNFCIFLFCFKGRVLWHKWQGVNKTAPTFNDWRAMLKDAEEEQPNQIFDMDARQYGYCNIVEKMVATYDGSVLMAASGGIFTYKINYKKCL